MALTPLSNLPTQSDPSTFNTRAETFINSQLPNLVSEWNADIQTFNNASTTAQSTTSTTIGLGSRTFTIQLNKTFFAGMRVRIAFSATEWMEGHVTSYSGVTLVVLVDLISATVTTRTTWNIFLVPAVDVTSFANFTPVLTSGGGTLGATVSGARIKQVGKLVFCNYDIAINGIGTGSGFIRATLPVTANLTALFSGSGRNRTTFNQLQVITDTSTTIAIFRYDGVFPVSANFENLTVSFFYEAA